MIHGEVKGGIIILKLKKTEENAKNVTLKVSYETRDGKKDSAEAVVEFENSGEYYSNTGIRKGILLSRYVNLIKNWTEYERSKDDRYLITPFIGIFDYPMIEKNINESDDDNYYGYPSENERISIELTISEQYKKIFNTFKTYMEKEIEAIGDEDLKQEIDILEKILAV